MPKMFSFTACKKPSFHARSVYNLENCCFRVLCLEVWTADNFYSLSSILILLDAQLQAGCFKSLRYLQETEGPELTYFLQD